MTCHECEHNKQRAQLWRNEAYKHAGHPLDWEPELMLRPKPLTEEEIWRTYKNLWMFHPAEEPRLAGDVLKFARALERAHGIT